MANNALTTGLAVSDGFASHQTGMPAFARKSCHAGPSSVRARSAITISFGATPSSSSRLIRRATASHSPAGPVAAISSSPLASSVGSIARGFAKRLSEMRANPATRTLGSDADSAERDSTQLVTPSGRCSSSRELAAVGFANRSVREVGCSIGSVIVARSIHVSRCPRILYCVRVKSAKPSTARNSMEANGPRTPLDNAEQASQKRPSLSYQFCSVRHA